MHDTCIVDNVWWCITLYSSGVQTCYTSALHSLSNVCKSKYIWDRNTRDALCCHSNLPSKNMADFSAEFARQKKRKCLAALVISELLDESEDNLRRRGKTRAWIRRRSKKGHFNNIAKELNWISSISCSTCDAFWTVCKMFWSCLYGHKVLRMR